MQEADLLGLLFGCECRKKCCEPPAEPAQGNVLMHAQPKTQRRPSGSPDEPFLPPSPIYDTPQLPYTGLPQVDDLGEFVVNPDNPASNQGATVFVDDDGEPTEPWEYIDADVRDAANWVDGGTEVKEEINPKDTGILLPMLRADLVDAWKPADFENQRMNTIVGWGVTMPPDFVADGDPMPEHFNAPGWVLTRVTRAGKEGSWRTNFLELGMVRNLPPIDPTPRPSLVERYSDYFRLDVDMFGWVSRPGTGAAPLNTPAYPAWRTEITRHTPDLTARLRPERERYVPAMHPENWAIIYDGGYTYGYVEPYLIKAHGLGQKNQIFKQERATNRLPEQTESKPLTDAYQIIAGQLQMVQNVSGVVTTTLPEQLLMREDWQLWNPTTYQNGNPLPGDVGIHSPLFTLPEGASALWVNIITIQEPTTGTKLFVFLGGTEAISTEDYQAMLSKYRSYLEGSDPTTSDLGIPAPWNAGFYREHWIPNLFSMEPFGHPYMATPPKGKRFSGAKGRVTVNGVYNNNHADLTDSTLTAFGQSFSGGTWAALRDQPAQDASGNITDYDRIIVLHENNRAISVVRPSGVTTIPREQFETEVLRCKKGQFIGFTSEGQGVSVWPLDRAWARCWQAEVDGDTEERSIVAHVAWRDAYKRRAKQMEDKKRWPDSWYWPGRPAKPPRKPPEKPAPPGGLTLGDVALNGDDGSYLRRERSPFWLPSVVDSKATDPTDREQPPQSPWNLPDKRKWKPLLTANKEHVITFVEVPRGK